VDSSEDPIIGLTLDGVITDWNPAAERLYGYSCEEALGASIAIVPPELRGSTNLPACVGREGDRGREDERSRVPA